MDLKNIKAQLELSKKAIQETKNQNRIFETILQEAIKGAPKEDKKEIQRLQNMSRQAINLAKQGKLEEAQTLIKSFSDGGQNS